jgi:hypothetical protein
MYDHANKRPLSPSANSRLPIDHPDYSPDIHCPPKLLFPSARRAKKTASTNRRGAEKRSSKSSKKRALSVSWSDDEDGKRMEQDKLVAPIKLDFGGSPRSRSAIATRGATEPARA